jgi:hypothetical protein
LRVFGGRKFLDLDVGEKIVSRIGEHDSEPSEHVDLFRPLSRIYGSRAQAACERVNLDHLKPVRKLTGTANGAINVFFVQTDGAGKSLDLTQEAYDVRLNKDEYETYLRTGMTYRRTLVLKKDAKTLRILVADRSTTAVGTLIVPLSKVK